MNLKRVFLVSMLAVLMLPLAALAFVKPLRVVVPSLMPGISCPRPNICTDSVARNKTHCHTTPQVHPSSRSVARTSLCSSFSIS